MRDTTKFVSPKMDIQNSTYHFSKFASNLKINELSFETVSPIAGVHASDGPARQRNKTREAALLDADRP